ncbi:AroB-related putative sugar phosphate phospholyase (cyclizing) [Leptospira adleri]|uniref:AroB-related putative sugar phosphate phospholyase (cyclizing) n=1 Tax=Leptospira adleri TaxID=2023186 RepID=UPI0010834117|nr:AroB-related putative sugar phosphate phospholyase (cyclizing) [Leptospira adleri]TGM56506.1 3-dehydroquinate synthase [Leptospira adleri]
MSDSIRIKSSQRDYEVVFNNNIFDHLEELDKQESFFVIDTKVYSLYFKHWVGLISLEKRLFLINAEEQNKNLESAQSLIKSLVEGGVKRNSRVVAIGGGITQDIVCFTASVLYRGIPWVFIPTTLLAQADSCIGGKSSINFQSVKNLIGTFYPPEKIFIDTLFLNSLTNDDIKSGIGEMYHYFLHSASDLTQRLHLMREDVLLDRSLLIDFIRESLSIKKKVIEIDEFDRGERRKFNYGHTFGHAIETLTNYAINHGQAVTIGMDLANFLSHRLGLMSKEDYLSMRTLLRVNFPETSFVDFSIDHYCDLLKKDKKNVSINLTCILSRGAGKLEIRELELNTQIRDLITEYFSTEYSKN